VSSSLLALVGVAACAAGLPPALEGPCGDPVDPREAHPPAADENLAASGAADANQEPPPAAPRPAAAPEPEPPVPQGLDADALLALTADECYAQIDAWNVPYERVADAPPAIETPVRLTGPVAGVTYAIPWPVTNHHDVLDCRLAAALAEWSVLLRALGVVEVRIYSFYREGSRQGVGAAARGRPSQHRAGLAIDARWFVLASGETLDVLADWRDPGTDETCDGAVDDPRAAVLLSAFCGAWTARLFHVQLSPAHNREHANHFHLDLGGGNGGRYID